MKTATMVTMLIKLRISEILRTVTRSQCQLREFSQLAGEVQIPLSLYIDIESIRVSEVAKRTPTNPVGSVHPVLESFPTHS